ncbi:hypothetical protein E4656_03070 [Natronospirillum operosum]|uniref:Uncharacterized protein n=1 Tax=Natronospirillum operosum TaxID=2759953 RepID=A0A4Z0WEG4_9GAMM|nr:hypothetical protein [Natronospirillum operosum]TGG95420.1 hypothetical protein E4656_03070 [Natronospirillum operosum]
MRITECLLFVGVTCESRNVEKHGIKNQVTAYIYSDPISERTSKNRRNALFFAGLSILHFWNPIVLTGFGFNLDNGSSYSVSLILVVLLTYLSITLIFNIISDLTESIEKIGESDEKQTKQNWHIVYEWAKSLTGSEGDGPYRDPTLDSTKTNIQAMQEKIPELLALEARHRESVKRAKVARFSRTIVVDIVLPLSIILGAFICHAITLTSCT